MLYSIYDAIYVCCSFLDLTIVKEVFLGTRDADKEPEFLQACKKFGLENYPAKECCLTILYGYGLSDNRFLYIVCPPVLCRYDYLD